MRGGAGVGRFVRRITVAKALRAGADRAESIGLPTRGFLVWWLTAQGYIFQQVTGAFVA